MRVKDVIICALEKLNLHAVAEKLAAGEQTDGFEKETINTLLCCYNAVEDELARHYLPLTKKDCLTSTNGEYPFTSFSRIPVNIRQVTADGKKVKFSCGALGIKTDEKSIAVEYYYAPEKKAVNDYTECAAEAGEQLIAYGMAAEYCFINGEADLAAGFENKYRQAVDAAQSKLRCRSALPPRRWV